MTKPTFDSDTILARIKSAVNVAGADTHRDCYYALYENPRDPNGKPVNFDDGREILNQMYDLDERPNLKPVESHCIVGVVLNDLGLPLEALGAFENTSVNAIYADRDSLPFDIDAEGWEALGEAQSRQDDGQSWGDAADAADRRVGALMQALAGGPDGEYDHPYYNVANKRVF